MLRLSTERPTLEVELDGEAKRVPLTFTRQEMDELSGAESSQDAMFAFFRRYLGDGFDALDDLSTSALLKAWNDARDALGEPGMGES